MSRGVIIGLFSALVLAQIATPLSMIAKRESILKEGEQFKFKTAPYDPYDAFRGRYISLRLDEDKVPKDPGVSYERGQKVYAHVAVDDQGFARLTGISKDIPKGTPYIIARFWYSHGKEASLDLPIDRYYMEEKAAPEAEKVYRQYTDRRKKNRQDAYVLVRVKDGRVAIEGFYVGGQKIEDVVREARIKGLL